MRYQSVNMSHLFEEWNNLHKSRRDYEKHEDKCMGRVWKWVNNTDAIIRDLQDRIVELEDKNDQLRQLIISPSKHEVRFYYAVYNHNNIKYLLVRDNNEYKAKILQIELKSSSAHTTYITKSEAYRTFDSLTPVDIDIDQLRGLFDHRKISVDDTVLQYFVPAFKKAIDSFMVRNVESDIYNSYTMITRRITPRFITRPLY